MERLIKRAAEADLYEGEWYGRPIIRKVRTPRAYRHPHLDAELRKARTLREAQLIREAREAGLFTPLIYFVDPLAAEIVMHNVRGRRLKELVEEDAKASLPFFREVGRIAAKLHRAGIVHGDLTTSNMIISGDHLILIDFGLSARSTRLEDMAVDIHLLRQALNSAHSPVAEEAFASVLAGYRREAGRDVEDLINRLKEIEARGRYARLG